MLSFPSWARSVTSSPSTETVYLFILLAALESREVFPASSNIWAKHSKNNTSKEAISSYMSRNGADAGDCDPHPETHHAHTELGPSRDNGQEFGVMLRQKMWGLCNP